MRSHRLAALALLFLCQCHPAAAETDYPARRVTIVVGFAAGGALDVATRVIAQELSQRWNQPVVVENRPGAESNLAARSVAESAPDGYTLVLLSNSIIINQSMYRKLDYSIRQLTPVA